MKLMSGTNPAQFQFCRSSRQYYITFKIIIFKIPYLRKIIFIYSFIVYKFFSILHD